MIYIFSHEEDLHSISVKNAIERKGCTVKIIDNSKISNSGYINYSISEATEEFSFTYPGSGEIKITNHDSIWWRRQQSFELRDNILHPKLVKYVKEEWTQALLGGLFSTKVYFLNPISKSRSSNYKILQLSLAQQFGLKIPKTVISNKSEVLRDFILSNNYDCIYKVFKGPDFGLLETRKIEINGYLNFQDNFEYSPTIIQKHVHGLYDLRITVVGDTVFSAKIDYKKGRHKVDSRMDRVPTTPYQLPQSVEEKILKLTHSLGLNYATIDLRKDLSNEYIFFEVNPEGQFLWIEIETDLLISDKIAEMLIDKKNFAQQ